jgi:hypothetical protein
VYKLGVETSGLGVWKKQHLNLYTGVETIGLGVWKKQHLSLYTGVETSGLGIILNAVSIRHLVLMF